MCCVVDGIRGRTYCSCGHFGAGGDQVVRVFDVDSASPF